MMYNIQRPDTVELSIPSYLKRSRQIPSRDELLDAVLKSLGPNARSSIKCVQQSANGSSFRVSFKPEAARLRDQLLTKGIYLKGTFCYLTEAQPKHKVITVSNLPFEMGDDLIKGFFSHYGEVRGLIRNIDKHGIETGDRRLLMVLSHHIPSKVSLDPFRAQVRYLGQPCCCFNCNWWGHKDRHCPLKDCCGKCGSRGHYTFACDEDLVYPPALSTKDPFPTTWADHPGVIRRELDDDLLQVADDDDDADDHELPPAPMSGSPDDPPQDHCHIEVVNESTDQPETSQMDLSTENLLPDPNESPSLFPNNVSQDSLLHVINQEGQDNTIPSSLASASLFPNLESQDSDRVIPDSQTSSLSDSLSSLSSPSFSHMLQARPGQLRTVPMPTPLHFTNLKRLSPQVPSAAKNARTDK